MIRTAETAKKQLDEAQKRRKRQAVKIEPKDQILTLLDKEIGKAVTLRAISGGRTIEEVQVDFDKTFGFPDGHISCQLAANVKRELQAQGYGDIQIFRETDDYLGEKVCVRIVVSFDWEY